MPIRARGPEPPDEPRDEAEPIVGEQLGSLARQTEQPGEPVDDAESTP